MVEPKAPAAARIMAANSLLDRGWGKAAQLLEVDSEIRQLVEVKLSVVQATPLPMCFPANACLSLRLMKSMT